MFCSSLHMISAERRYHLQLNKNMYLFFCLPSDIVRSDTARLLPWMLHEKWKVDRPAHISDLKRNAYLVISEIKLNLCVKVTENILKPIN